MDTKEANAKSQSTKLKSVLSKTRSRSRSQSVALKSSTTSGESLKFAPEVITSVREYCNQEPPNYLLYINLEQPLYQPVNFKILDQNSGHIIREKKKETKQAIASTFSNDKDLLKKKVRLESLQISKYHLNGFIICSSLSVDQSCYIRVSCDNWNTFRETQAILLQQNHENVKNYRFDFMLPLPKSDIFLHQNRLNRRDSIDSTESGISVGSNSSSLSCSGSLDLTKSENRIQNLSPSKSNLQFQKYLLEHFGYEGPPKNFSICAVMRNQHELFYDFNDGGGGYDIELVEQGGGGYQIF